jgi:hypothetical protein
MVWQPKVQTDWDGDEALSHLVEERTLLPEDTPWELGKRDLYGYFPAAVQSVAQLSMYANMEHVRLKASEFIINMTMRIEDMERQGRGSPLDELIKNVTTYANENGNH